MSRLSVLLVLFFLLPPKTVVSQSFLTGVVIDKDTNQPLSKASVRIASSGEFILTDESGAFKIEITKTITTDTLLVTYVGYGKLIYPISNRQPSVVIKLTREATTLNEA